MTFIIRSDVDTGLEGLPVVVTLAEEIALARLASCREWWRASEGFNGARWLGRKAGLLMTPKASASPSLTTGGQNGRPYLLMASGGDPGVLKASAGLELINPAADWSLAWAAHLPAGNSAFFGNAVAASNPFFGVVLGGGNRMDVYINGASALFNSGATTFANQFLYAVLSYRASPRSMVLRVNGVQRGASTSTAQTIANQELTLGAAWDGAGSRWYSAWNGRFYDVMAFNTALATAENAEDLTAVEDYFRVTYGVA